MERAPQVMAAVQAQLWRKRKPTSIARAMAPNTSAMTDTTNWEPSAVRVSPMTKSGSGKSAEDSEVDEGADTYE